MVKRFSLIQGALSKLGIPFDESTYFSDTIIQIAEREFENIMSTAFTGTNLSMNVTTANLNVSVDDNVVYRGETYTPYMLPDDFLFLVDKPEDNIFLGRNRLYRVGTGEFTIKYTKINSIDKLPANCFKYLEYYLASEIAPAVNRRSVQNELFQQAMYHKDLLNKSEIKNNVDIFSSMASQSGI